MRTLHFQQTLGTGSFGTANLAELSSAPGHRETVAVKVLVNTGPEGACVSDPRRSPSAGSSPRRVHPQGDGHGEPGGARRSLVEFVDGCDLDSLVADQGFRHASWLRSALVWPVHSLGPARHAIRPRVLR